jgi:hypothetical protein
MWGFLFTSCLPLSRRLINRWREASIALKSAQQSAGGLLEGEDEDGDDEFEFK